MEYYYYNCSSSSPSKKLMIATLLLLIITTIGSVAGEKQGCGAKKAPVDSGACKGYYLYCTTELITELIANAPVDSVGYTSSQTYPDGNNPPGGVRGEAVCVAGSYLAGCRNCLLDIKEKLTWYCSSFEGGYYYSQYCYIKYHQIP